MIRKNNTFCSTTTFCKFLQLSIAETNKTKKTYKCNGRYYNPLFFAHSPGNTPIVCYDEETVLIPQDATTVMRMKEQIYNSPLINDSKLMQLYDGLTEDSNPVLFLLHIKSI